MRGRWQVREPPYSLSAVQRCSPHLDGSVSTRPTPLWLLCRALMLPESADSRSSAGGNHGLIVELACRHAFTCSRLDTWWSTANPLVLEGPLDDDPLASAPDAGAEQVLVRPPTQTCWSRNLSELLLLCNEAASRAAKRHPGDSHKKDADGVQSKPLGLEYMADRFETDDPIWGYMVSHPSTPPARSR